MTRRTDRDPPLGAEAFDELADEFAARVETGLLRRIGYYWDLTDYREVDGVMVPFRIARSRKGGSTTLVFDRVAHNVPLEDNLFHMPPVVGVPLGG